MNIFPEIKTLDDYLQKIAGKSYIGVNKQDNGATVICYNISNSESFANAYEKESRGITFDKEGKIISRPLHKFFNLSEREEVQPHNLDWNKVTAIYDKMDGSMLTAGFMDGQYFIKSKKSFKSDVAVSAEKFSYANQKYIDFAKYCSLANLTPIFEFTSPEHRIVLRYETSNMTILHVRDTFTGVYLTPKEIQVLALKFDIPYNLPLDFSSPDIEALIHSLNKAQGIEGYVVQFENGQMFKMKTKWYMDLHHVVTFQRKRDIAKMVIDETIDDFIGYLTLNAPKADLSQIHHINNTIGSFIVDMNKEVVDLATPFIGVPFKDVALAFKGHKYFSFIMNYLRGNDLRYFEYYKDYHLKEDWSLDEIDLGDLGEFKLGM